MPRPPETAFMPPPSRHSMSDRRGKLKSTAIVEPRDAIMQRECRSIKSGSTDARNLDYRICTGSKGDARPVPRLAVVRTHHEGSGATAVAPVFCVGPKSPNGALRPALRRFRTAPDQRRPPPGSPGRPHHARQRSRHRSQRHRPVRNSSLAFSIPEILEIPAMHAWPESENSLPTADFLVS